METPIMKNLFKKIHDKDLLLAIIGSDYAGLPTAALFADAGLLSQPWTSIPLIDQWNLIQSHSTIRGQQ